MSEEVTEVFLHDGTEWSGQRALEAFIRRQGWSIGPTDTTGIRGVICEPDVQIAKWKNLTPIERDECDGQVRTVSGRGRDGDFLLVACPWRGSNPQPGDYESHGAADAVLASDELQAIRQALRGMAQDSPRASMSCPPSMVLADRYGLPPSVVAWVMEGDA